MIRLTKYSSTKYACVLVLFFALGPLLSQTTESNSIIGSWLFDGTSSFAEISREANTILEANPHFKTKMQSIYVGKTIVFFPDGMYSQVLGNGTKTTGKWSTKENHLTITTSDGALHLFTYKITLNRLLITIPEKGEESKSLVQNQYFTKI
ncbi:hypothetical protein KIM67_15285 [Flagellimonas sp. 389]|uniref:hypothetical protein n=1 Tax=Flagellimonas sp. 389 TaxID=2835862 RepID=UPI001BD43F43|nr:hypothetical protein [Flagellimonas sp. 389]MBS9463782.1 hypothetical protein [Flagellimonas sp. 389]